MARIIVYLADSEVEALQAMAERELRGLREQARYLIIRGLAAGIEAQAGGASEPAAEFLGTEQPMTAGASQSASSNTTLVIVEPGAVINIFRDRSQQVVQHGNVNLNSTGDIDVDGGVVGRDRS